MKKIIFLVLMSIFLLTSCEFEEEPIDVINEYKITVDPRSDGTLDMRYYIEWTVLDSTREGPLSWVIIGVPNKFVDELAFYSSDIDNVYYYADGGAYLRIDLVRNYYSGEKVFLDFSFHQSRIFTTDNNYVYYSFIPGWFDEIKVEKLTVLWANNGVIGNNSSSSIDGYFCWEKVLDFGESIKVNLQYDKNAFPDIDLSQTYSADDGDISMYIFFGIFAFILVVIILIVIISNLNNDGYYSYRGFSGRRSRFHIWYHFRHHGVNRHGHKIQNPKINSSDGGKWSGGSGCACACACACAGGGRAGCSRKDFYQTSVKMEEIINKLKKDSYY